MGWLSVAVFKLMYSRFQDCRLFATILVYKRQHLFSLWTEINLALNALNNGTCIAMNYLLANVDSNGPILQKNVGRPIE